jgi:hypothetical protein
MSDSILTKRSLIEALEALPCPDETEVYFDSSQVPFQPVELVQYIDNKTNSYISLYNSDTY